MSADALRLPGLKGEVALITGASRGIGAAIADELARQGAVVVGTATTAEGAERVEHRLAALGRGRGAVLDVNSDAGIQALFDSISQREGAVTVLVNNAGITRDNLLIRMKPGEWDEILETNLSSVFRLCRAAVRGMMKARRGRIINITSVVAQTGNPGQCNYAAAKAGMVGFSKALARELGSRSITVNCVAPGFIDTDMTRTMSAEQRDQLAAGIPLGRLGSPDEVAAAVAFLASSAGAYITGETLSVNGGLYMP